MDKEKIEKAVVFLESVIDSYEESTAIKVQAAKILADIVFRYRLSSLEERIDSLTKKISEHTNLDFEINEAPAEED